MARARPKSSCLAVCTPGLEALVREELVGLGIRPGDHVRGGVTFRATTRQLYAANLWLRTASRVLVRIGHFRARSFATLEREAAALDWQDIARVRTGVRFRIRSTGSRLYHTSAIAERLARAMELPISDADQAATLVVRVDRDQFTVSADASGEGLWRRGWRLEGAKAPLRATLAAALVRASAWRPDAPLVDPFCGSGTIAIEAALAGRDMAPGLARSFAFEHWPAFEPGTWASVVGEARARAAAGAGTRPVVVGRDRDAGAVVAARANAARAGVADAVDLDVAPISDLEAPAQGPGWILTNPPYGRRVGDGGDDLRNLYARFGQVAHQRFAGWSVGLLVADRALAGHTGLILEERLRTTNGGVPVSLLCSPRPAG